MIKLLHPITRLVLFLLSLAFLSFFLVTLEGFDFVKPVVEYATAYLPILLIPVGIALIVSVLLRWLGKDRDEEIGFGDLLWFILAVAFQLAAIIVWRYQGNDVAGPLAQNIPDVRVLEQHAESLGVLGVAILQFLAFLCHWKADPDPKARRDPDPS